MGLLNNLTAGVDVTKLSDQTKQSEFTDNLPKEGPHMGRFIWYVEIGKHLKKGNPKYKTKDEDQNQALLGFELTGKKSISEYEKDGEKKEFHPMLTANHIKISGHVKSPFKKLFDIMRAGSVSNSSATHFIQLLNEPVVAKVKHNTVEDKTYANWRDDEGNFMVQPPVFTNPETLETQRVNVPPAQEENFKVLIWDQPTKEQWDSLYIDGTHTRKEKRKVDGKEVEVEVEHSNNWIQDLILKAKNFKGSPLHDLLEGLGELNFDDPSQPQENDGADPLEGMAETVIEDTPEPDKPATDGPSPAVADPDPAPPVDKGSADDEAEAMLKAMGLA